MKPKRMMKPRARQRGYLVAEMVIGIALIALLIVTLSTMVQRQNRAAAGLTQQRELHRAAEQALLSLQSPQVPSPQDVQLSVARLDHPAPLGGRAWVTITVARDGRQATLTGLARLDRLPRTQEAP